MDQEYSADFPTLKNVQEKKTSDKTDHYNCIAWAFGRNTRRWWPNTPQYYWPINVVGMTDMQAFEAWFTYDGWTQCGNAMKEDGFIKIVLYGKNGSPKHAARQLPNGHWTSKLGSDIDLYHSLSEMTGPAYGEIMKIYKKPISTIASPPPDERSLPFGQA